MLTVSQRARLGAFMIIGASLLVLFIMIPVGSKLTQRQHVYYSYFDGEKSLSGLEPGADIKYHGVRIGKVTRISYDPRNISRIKAEFRIRADFPMKTDMWVETGFLGITGLLYVEVQGGTNEAPLLASGSELPSKLSLMANLTGKADVIIAKIELLLNHLTTFTAPESLASVRAILTNTASITAGVDSFVQAVSPDVRVIASSARTTMQKIDLIAADIKMLTTDVNKSIDPDQIVSILASVDSTAQSLKTLSESLDLTIRQSREDFAISLENLRQTMENANELSKILTENPSLILRGDAQKERNTR